MPITLSGTSGITTPGMESTGMPTVGGDAVVESGSNSDGEWTRWADGTQYTTSSTSFVEDITTEWGLIYISSTSKGGLTFPVSFISTPNVINCIFDATGISVIIPATAGKASATEGPGFRSARGTTVAGITLQYVSHAIGRWK